MAAAALRLLDAHPEIALLFADVLMPELDGRELAARVLQRRRGLPVLVTSGRSLEQLASRVSRALDAM